MRILDWEVEINHDGSVRCAQHPENGNATWINGRFVGHADVPPAVFEWLTRPQLREIWEAGRRVGVSGAPYDTNPYNGEPTNKDNDPS